MTAVLVGEFDGAFVASLGIAAIWLVIAYIIPPLRTRPQISYPIAMVLAVLLQLITYGGQDILNILAAAICIILLFVQMQRAKRKISNINDTSAQ